MALESSDAPQCPPGRTFEGLWAGEELAVDGVADPSFEAAEASMVACRRRAYVGVGAAWVPRTIWVIAAMWYMRPFPSRDRR